MPDGDADPTAAEADAGYVARPFRRVTAVLVANRGEIAVRVVRGARDAGIRSIAVYAADDADALHVRLADEAYALPEGGVSATYLSAAALLDVAARAGADAVHPGYGFLAENAAFARSVLDAGLTWIGPPPEAIEALGDKVRAREIATAVGAPLAVGSDGPVPDAAAVERFADEFGLPLAIKAAHGGGGRGLKVARTREEIPARFDSAVREAVGAFGRGEVYVERYLDRPRHVETQCLADAHGAVVVVSTRDCTLQRRHQKLVEEAPAPFLSDAQREAMVTASKAILRKAGYAGAGTCEFLVGLDGTLSFLEVNTRLQVEHTVTEEVTGIDLVGEQFRLAAGEPLGYDDPAPRGHSIEFRINAEDPGRDFLPGPGRLTAWSPPAGPGIRVDSGYVRGQTVPGGYDSLLGKLIVTAEDRPRALARARRALAEFEVAGMPTVLPFHRAVVTDPAFVGDPAAPDGGFPAGPGGGFTVHTRWIETGFDNRIPAWSAEAEAAAGGTARQRVVVEVGGKRLEVVLPGWLGTAVDGRGRDGLGGAGAPPQLSDPNAARRRGHGGRGRGRGAALALATGDAVVAPMQGTVVKVEVAEGDEVVVGDALLVLEAMKMEQPITAHRAGTVRSLAAEAGATVASGAVLLTIEA